MSKDVINNNHQKLSALLRLQLIKKKHLKLLSECSNRSVDHAA